MNWAHSKRMRILSPLVTVLVFFSCAHTTQPPDPKALEKAIEKLERAATAVQDAIDATRDALPPQPEQTAPEVVVDTDATVDVVPVPALEATTG